MAETIKERIERELHEQLDKFEARRTNHKIEVQRCHFCPGVVHAVGTVYVCNACGAETRRTDAADQSR